VLSRFVLGLVASIAIAACALKRGSLSPSGALATVAVGTLTALGGGGSAFAALVVFFVSSSLLGKVGAPHKAPIKLKFSKTDTRDALQVAANGAVATLCFGLAGITSNPIWHVAGLGSLAAATGDTWATELGTLSRSPPRSLLTGQPVPAGTSGAVSAAGMAATVAGAALIGVMAGHHALWWVTLGGVLGALADSVVGATLQGAYHCDRCDEDCEAERHHCGGPTVWVRGYKRVDNEVVNLAATATGAVCAGVLGAFFA
jgi:uncharacterized protein (TIGR00297 family)